MRAYKLVIFTLLLTATGCAGAHNLTPAVSTPIGTLSAARAPVSTCPCFNVLYNFGGVSHDGVQPVAVTPFNGALYGVTSMGGSSNIGTVFSIGTDGSNYSVLYNFTGQGDGGFPTTPLVPFNGSLYGVAAQQNQNYVGVYYTVAPGGAETAISDLGGDWMASAPVVVNGSFYGTSPSGRGGVYDWTPQGSYSTIWSFGQWPTSPFEPVGGVTNLDGVLYGVTSEGGNANGGVLYWVALSGKTMHVVHQFSQSGLPQGPLVALNGSLYGVTESGGKYGSGTLFEFTPVSKTWRVLHEFGGPGDGSNPAPPVVLNGVLYGVAGAGGANGLGAIYSVTAKGVEKLPYSFTAAGVAVYAGPLTPYNGALYGASGGGGAYDGGLIFSFQP